MKTMISASEYAKRRQTLLAKLPDNSAVIIPSSAMQDRGNGTEFPFSQDRNFYYLTGFEETEACLFLSNRSDMADTEVPSNHFSLLFCLEKDKQQEIWHGRRLGVAAAPQVLAVDAAEDIEKLESQLPELLNNHDSVYLLLGQHLDNESTVFDALQTLRAAPKQSRHAPQAVIDLSPIINEMRLIKSEREIAVMQAAADMSCRAHKRAMQFAAPGKFEYQLEAEITHEFMLSGARQPAYNSIVGSGENACILHYTDNRDELHDGDLVLIDAGADYQGYAADITRTFPVSGQFSPEQKAIYELVLNAQLSAMTLIQPGNTMKQATDRAVEVICAGLIELGILQGTLADVIASMAWRQYFMHGLGHWLGLNVHDVGMYKVDGVDRPLQAGMVLTVEPGIYIDSDSEADARWHGIGVRIEDNVLITETGHKVLTAAVPKTVADIEELMSVSTS